MKCIIFDKKHNYDGSQISSLWGYNIADVQDDSIIAFRGACDVKIEHMIDLEDKKQGDMIFSTDMLHFIIEHFDSTDLKLVYARQRLFTAIVSEVLSSYFAGIKRVFINLISNGSRYAESKIVINVNIHQNHLIIDVIDDGKGFEYGKEETVFDRFYKGNNGGSGIGLALTKEIVEKHGGKIEAVNHMNYGAIFKMEFTLKNK